jgi:hypothetical protein
MSIDKYESLALHLYDTSPEIRKAPWWMIHRAIDFNSVMLSKTGEAIYRDRVNKLVKLLGQLTCPAEFHDNTEASTEHNDPAVEVAPSSSDTSA